MGVFDLSAGSRNGVCPAADEEEGNEDGCRLDKRTLEQVIGHTGWKLGAGKIKKGS